MGKLRVSLLILTAWMSIYMAWVVIDTSLQSNLFKEWDSLARIPWMEATIKDFYVLMVPLLVWMGYKERSWAARVLWGLSFIGLGSIMTSFYLFIQVWKLKPGEPLESLLLRRPS